MTNNKNTSASKQGVFDDALISFEDALYETVDSNDYGVGEKIVKHCVQTFSMPGDEPVMERIINEPSVIVTNKVITPCPKEGIIMVYLEYDKISEE